MPSFTIAAPVKPAMLLETSVLENGYLE